MPKLNWILRKENVIYCLLEKYGHLDMVLAILTPGLDMVEVDIFGSE